MRRSAATVFVALITVAGLVGTMVDAAGAVTTSQIDAKALPLSAMPAGWTVDHSGGGGVTNIGGCLNGLEALKKRPKGIVRTSVSYKSGTFPELQEILEAGSGSAARFHKFTAVVGACKTFSFSATGSKITGTVGALSFPKVGNSSSAYAISLTSQGLTADIDLIFFRVGQIYGELLYGDVAPDVSVVHAFATEAVNKILGKPVTIPTVPSDPTGTLT